MNTIHDYCDASYKRLVGLKTGLHNHLTKAENVKDDEHIQTTTILKGLISEVEDEIKYLKNECPADWSVEKEKLDRKLEKIETTLKEASPV